MWRALQTATIAALLSTPYTALAGRQTNQYFTTNDALLSRDPFSLYEKRPEDCPPCFNCNLDDFACLQFGNCTKASGKCSCPPGFGGEDCSLALCGSLAQGKDRAPRNGPTCECEDGWEGINCNVCKDNSPSLQAMLIFWVFDDVSLLSIYKHEANNVEMRRVNPLPHAYFSS